MDKRLLIAVAVSMGILFLWWKIFPPAPPAQAPAPAAVLEPSRAAYDAGTPAAAPPPTASGASPQATPAARLAETLVTLESPEANFVFSSRGASLREIKLKDRQFLLDRARPASGMQIVSTSTENTAPLRTTFAKADFPWNDAVAWTVVRPSQNAVVFRAETDEVVVEKRFALEPQRYRLALSVTIQNKASKPMDHGLVVHLYGAQDPEKKGGGFLSYATANLAEMVCHVADKANRATVEALVKEPQSYVGGVRWAAAGDKYFAIAAVPFPETPPRDRGCKQQAIDASLAEVALSFASRTLAPGEKTEYPFAIFAGPKYAHDLELVRPGGQDAKLADSVDVTFAPLSRPMLALLKQFYRLSGNWGVAIILLTIFIRLVTFYPPDAGVGQEDAGVVGKDRGAAQEVRERQAEAWRRNHEHVQGARRVAFRRLPAESHPDADLDCAFLDAQLRRRTLPLVLLLVHHRPVGEGSLLPGTPAHGLGHVPANAHVAGGNGSAAAEDDVGDDAGDVHRFLALPARWTFHLHADQLPHRHLAAAVRESKVPPRPDASARGQDVRCQGMHHGNEVGAATDEKGRVQILIRRNPSFPASVLSGVALPDRMRLVRPPA